MAANQPPWPREWLMTDERIGDRLWQGIETLPAGAGVLFRHYATAQAERAELAREVATQCRDRQLMLAVAGDAQLARSLEAALVHNPAGGQCTMPFSRSAHSAEEAGAACRSGASLIFLSPIFPTRSHPGRLVLPRLIARQIVATCPVPVIALGGMNRSRFDAIRADGYYGWAGIDAWLGDIRT